jgi:hypothetical protein
MARRGISLRSGPMYASSPRAAHGWGTSPPGTARTSAGTCSWTVHGLASEPARGSRRWTPGTLVSCSREPAHDVGRKTSSGWRWDTDHCAVALVHTGQTPAAHALGDRPAHAAEPMTQPSRSSIAVAALPLVNAPATYRDHGARRVADRSPHVMVTRGTRATQVPAPPAALGRRQSLHQARLLTFTLITCMTGRSESAVGTPRAASSARTSGDSVMHQLPRIGGAVRYLTPGLSRNMTATRQRLPKLTGGRCCLGGPPREESRLGPGRAGAVAVRLASPGERSAVRPGGLHGP